jgi:serine/threonine protein kinase
MPFYGKPLSFGASNKVYTGIARGIHHLHMIGLNHRDIKPSNIMILNGKPTVVDFGLSTWEPFTSTRVRTSEVQTIWYRAPETVYDYRARRDLIDDWSFGVLLASKERHLFTPNTSGELRKELRSLFGQKISQYDPLPEAKPVKDLGEATEFLQLSPVKRKTVSEFCQLPMLNDTMVALYAPVSETLFKCHVNVNIQVLSWAENWVTYFAAMEYYGRCGDLITSISIARILYNGTSSGSQKCLYRQVKSLKAKLYVLNTFFILLLMYPKNAKKFILPCFYLSLGGNTFPIWDQVKWIEKVFILRLIPLDPQKTKGLMGKYNEMSRVSIDKLYLDLLTCRFVTD